MVTTKNIIMKKDQIINVTVIGAGIVGSSTALHLTNLGYKVSLIDPQQQKIIRQSATLNGSQASLGILMGYVYRRAKGRGWKLRQRSMELWPQVIDQINTHEKPIQIKTPLVQLATSSDEFQAIEKVVEAKSSYGVELLNTASIKYFTDILERKQYGGLISHHDGRIEPINILKSIIEKLKKYGVRIIEKKVISLNRNSQKKYWDVYFDEGKIRNQDVIVICSSLGTEKLLNPLGYSIKLEPILGQVLELEYKSKDIEYEKWPAVLSTQGFNLIIEKENRILVGATLEPGVTASLNYKKKVHNLNNYAPNWLKDSSIKSSWYGIRAKPINQASPILETLEPGLIINSGHYRNGILLAPACAEWVGIEINKCLI